MTKIVVRELIWDAWNIEHIRKHRVTQDEVIVSIRNTAYHRHAHSGRYLSVGRSGKRIITVILRRKRATTYYLVTARDANKKERSDVYEKEKNQQNSKI